MKHPDRNVASCIVYNKKNEILLQKKTEDYPLLPGGYWCFLGGEIEGNENPLEAIRREIKEEIDVELKDVRLFKKWRYKLNEKVKGEESTFISLFDRKISDIRLKEGGGFAFFSKNELKDIKITPVSKPIIKEFFDKIALF